MKTFEFEISPDQATKLFEEVATMKANYPDQCFAGDQLWSDQSEKVNGITRDRATDTLCHSIAVYNGDWRSAEFYYSMKEDSDALRSSLLFKTVMSLVAPHELLQPKRAESGRNGD